TSTATPWCASYASGSRSQVGWDAECPALAEALHLLTELVVEESRRSWIQALAALRLVAEQVLGSARDDGSAVLARLHAQLQRLLRRDLHRLESGVYRDGRSRRRRRAIGDADVVAGEVVQEGTGRRRRRFLEADRGRHQEHLGLLDVQGDVPELVYRMHARHLLEPPGNGELVRGQEAGAVRRLWIFAVLVGRGAEVDRTAQGGRAVSEAVRQRDGHLEGASAARSVALEVVDLGEDREELHAQPPRRCHDVLDERRSDDGEELEDIPVGAREVVDELLELGGVEVWRHADGREECTVLPDASLEPVDVEQGPDAGSGDRIEPGSDVRDGHRSHAGDGIEVAERAQRVLRQVGEGHDERLWQRGLGRTVEVEADAEDGDAREAVGRLIGGLEDEFVIGEEPV